LKVYRRGCGLKEHGCFLRVPRRIPIMPSILFTSEVISLLSHEYTSASEMQIAMVDSVIRFNSGFSADKVVLPAVL
jgi:hypothetical protein